MTQKDWNANTKATNQDIILMYHQTESFNAQIKKLRDAKNKIPSNFGITKSNYLHRLKQLKDAGEIE